MYETELTEEVVGGFIPLSSFVAYLILIPGTTLFFIASKSSFHPLLSFSFTWGPLLMAMLKLSNFLYSFRYSLIESSFCFLAAKEEITLCYRHRPSRQTKMKLDFFAVQGEEKGPFFVYLLISIRWWESELCLSLEAMKWHSTLAIEE